MQNITRSAPPIKNEFIMFYTQKSAKEKEKKNVRNEMPCYFTLLSLFIVCIKIIYIAKIKYIIASHDTEYHHVLIYIILRSALFSFPCGLVPSFKNDRIRDKLVVFTSLTL